jgi:hypothetical protein
MMQLQKVIQMHPATLFFTLDQHLHIQRQTAVHCIHA